MGRHGNGANVAVLYMLEHVLAAHLRHLYVGEHYLWFCLFCKLNGL